jgi:CRISPR/Cas system-associated exonuclease Cas4 (RecB family)
MDKKQQISLQEEMDFWVKDFEKKIQRTNDIDLQVNENKQNIEYNYELIKALQKDIKEIKRTLLQLKHYNLIALKSRPLKELN